MIHCRQAGSLNRMRYIFSLLAATMLLINAGVALAATTRQTYWKGSSGDYRVEWSNADLEASNTKTGKTVFSARAIARANFALAQTNFKPGDVYEEDYELLSLVGDIMSIEYHARLPLQNGSKSAKSKDASSTGITRYVAIDLRSPQGEIRRLTSNQVEPDADQNLVNLSDLFGAKEALTAFNNDTIIQSTIDTATVTSLPDLVKSLNGKNLPAPDMCGRFDNFLLNEFAVHHLRGTKAAVRLGISGTDPRPELLSELGLVLPIPEAWQARFLLASQGKEGVLMSTLKRKSTKTGTHFKFKFAP